MSQHVTNCGAHNSDLLSNNDTDKTLDTDNLPTLSGFPPSDIAAYSERPIWVS